jgi:tRNA G46 methylase TrmB
MYEGQNEEPNSNLASTSSSQTNNTLLLRADLIDFWHQCLTSSTWQSIVHVHRHYILYPNPYPKKARLKSRFYAHPAFPLLMLTLMNDRNENDDNNSSCDDDNGIMIVRSNWRGYLEEFAMAVQVWEEAGLSSQDVRQQQQHLTNDPETTIMKKIGESKKRKWAMNGPARIMNVCETNAMTNFEAKYVACGEAVYELQIKPGGC